MPEHIEMEGGGVCIMGGTAGAEAYLQERQMSTWNSRDSQVCAHGTARGPVWQGARGGCSGQG